MFRFLVLFAMLLGIESPSFAQSIPVGVSRITYENGGEPLTLHTYRPPTYAGGPLILVFHGVKRNAEDYRNFAITMAERFRAIIITPE